MNYQEFKKIVIDYAIQKGLTEYELFHTESDDITMESLSYEVKSFSTSSTGGVSFRCLCNGQMGMASTELYSEEEAIRIVDAAMEQTLYKESKDLEFIYEGSPSYQEIDNTPITHPSAEQLKDMLLSSYTAIRKLDPRVSDASQTGVSHVRFVKELTNSKGLDLCSTIEYSALFGYAIVQEGGEAYSGVKIKADDFSKIDIQETAEKAVEEAISSIGNDSAPSGNTTVVFSQKAWISLMQTFFSIFSAEAAQKNLSLLKGKEGEIIASPLITLMDDPFYKDALTKFSFDDEGVAAYTKAVIENGCFKTFLHNLKTAHKAGIPSTGNGRRGSYASTVSIAPYNFYICPGEAGSCEDIFRTVDNGIYVTRLDGLHAGANAISGDFSLGSAGFLIRQGKKDRPAKNFTISGNFYQLLKDVILVGNDLEFSSPAGSTCLGAPTLAVKNIAVAGK